MKKVVSLILSLILAVVPVAALAANFTAPYLSAMDSSATVVFSADNGNYSDASPSVWGFKAEKDGMSISKIGSVNYLKFYRTESYTDGGNLVLSDTIYSATNRQKIPSLY